MGAGASSGVDELEELTERINKAARTPATTVRGDPLPDWLQPFDENLANNEGDEQKKREQQAAAPFAPASVAAAPTTPDVDDELVVDEEVIKEHDPDEQHGDRKIITTEEVRQHLLCHHPYRSCIHNCIRGRGQECDHRRQLEDHVEEIPEYHLDYCFPGDKLGQRLNNPRGGGEVQPHEEGGGGPVERIQRNVRCADGLGTDQRVWRQGQGRDCED